MQDLLQLPLQLQATLVAGYLGYMIFKRDHRNNEKNTDLWLLVLLLGLPTALVLHVVSSAWAYLSVLIAPVLVFLWLRWGESRWGRFLYKQRVSTLVNQGDVWKTLSSTTAAAATQIVLYHKNGKVYMCQGTVDFIDEPFAPFVMDEDAIAFYVTHLKRSAESDWETIEDVKLESRFGSMVTYFPRADIHLLEMRHSKEL